MTGPLPKPPGQRARRNAPTIPTTTLSAAGRPGPAPRSPIALEKSGKAWWAWAWKLPHAMAWSVGDLYVVARRAHLEDMLAALDAIESFDLRDYLDLSEDGRAVNGRLRSVLALVRSQAGNRLAVVKEMRELDDRLGLTPKGMAALHWTISPVKDDESEQRSTAHGRFADLRVVAGG